jgi:hypothetical protein
LLIRQSRALEGREAEAVGEENLKKKLKKLKKFFQPKSAVSVEVQIVKSFSMLLLYSKNSILAYLLETRWPTNLSLKKFFLH